MDDLRKQLREMQPSRAPTDRGAGFFQDFHGLPNDGWRRATGAEVSRDTV